MIQLFQITLLTGLAFLLIACGGEENGTAVADETEAQVERGPRPMMGPGSGMMERHMARVPEEYAGLNNPFPAEEESIERGAVLYTQYCETCHGPSGLGDGPGATGLDPAPAPIAHTGLMLGDDYLFWRISEGGAMEPFNSAMPAWKAALSEEQIWDVINYIQSLGRGGAGLAAEQAQRAEMLQQAVESDVISETEAELFDRVHAEMDGFQMGGVQGMGMGRMGNMDMMQEQMLAQLVANGSITEADATAFIEVHNRLVEAGLMQ